MIPIVTVEQEEEVRQNTFRIHSLTRNLLHNSFTIFIINHPKFDPNTFWVLVIVIQWYVQYGPKFDPNTFSTRNHAVQYNLTLNQDDKTFIVTTKRRSSFKCTVQVSCH